MERKIIDTITTDRVLIIDCFIAECVEKGLHFELKSAGNGATTVTCYDEPITQKNLNFAKFAL